MLVQLHSHISKSSICRILNSYHGLIQPRQIQTMPIKMYLILLIHQLMLDGI
jgi:hypothetical protein